MNMQVFWGRIWNDNVDFIIHLVGDIIKILLTICSMKFIILSINFLFTEKPIMVQCMEIAAYIGILMIFIIYVISDVHFTLKKLKKGGA